jgi:carboxyl-terminal processing protease
MATVSGMRKSILTAAAGIAIGAGLPALVLPVGTIFGLWPNRDLARSSAYLHDVLQLVNENYVDAKAADYTDLTHSALHGMVESLDPHSEFMESKDNQELEEDLSGEFGGIGVQVEVRAGKIVVVEPMPGTPGDRAGIRRGDEITRIDGQAVTGSASMDDVVDKLRGRPKTTVALSLLRPSTGREFSLTLAREIIKVDSVTGVRVLDEDVGYILLTEFSEHTGEQFADAVDRLLKKNINGLIIDLRNNPGGLLDAAVEVAEPFFRKGEMIVYTQGRKPGDREDYRAEAEGEPLQIPIAVLINEDTASAAEIVTGALKDTGRAVIVGERSFGKGSVQSIFSLKNGEGLRLTTAKYYTPSGISINQKGIAPQVEVVMTADEDDKLRQQVSRPDLTDPKEFAERFGFAPIADRQLRAAVDVLKGVELIEEQAMPAPAAGPPAKHASAKTAGDAVRHLSGRPPRSAG